MSEILAIIAHDLKNALGGLEADLARLRDQPDADAASQAHAHCQGLREQFVQFLTLYGAEQGQLRALSEDESPQSLLARLHSRWQERLRHATPPLDIVIAENQAAPAFWYLDFRLVHMALDAAIHNASRFARSRITLSCRQRDIAGQHWLELFVDDDGPGIGTSTDGDADHATGLGLALCQAIAQAHVLRQRHGQVSLAPLSGKAGGTRFTLRLP
jgi:signal transduction histidine kinase